MISEKKLIIFVFFIIYIISKIKLNINGNDINQCYLEFQNLLNLTFNNYINKAIRIGIYTRSLSDGGIQRITSKLLDSLDGIKIFKLYLFTQREREENEFYLSGNIIRIVIKDYNHEKYLIKRILQNKIDIFIYQFPKENEIKALNNLKNVKIIYYIHSNVFFWFYSPQRKVLNIYKEYINSKYVISLTPIESNYLFKKWGINSILFHNLLTYDYDNIIPSNLSENKILLIGRGRCKYKRFELGILAIEYIKNQLSDIKLTIISKDIGINYLKNYIINLNLENYIEIANYSSDPSFYYKSASINYLTSISESYSMVLSETKLYGIPSILLGLDYLSLSKNGTIIIYDDYPETLAKMSLKLLLNKLYKKKLSKESRNSVRNIKNINLINDWKKLLLLVYNGYENYTKYFNPKADNTKELKTILIRQINLMNRRINDLNNIKSVS